MKDAKQWFGSAYVHTKKAIIIKYYELQQHLIPLCEQQSIFDFELNSRIQIKLTPALQRSQHHPSTFKPTESETAWWFPVFS